MPVIDFASGFGGNRTCAVCGAPTDSYYRIGTAAFGSNLGGKGQEYVVNQIMLILQTKGSFSVSGLKPFWHDFEDALCEPCKNELKNTDKKKLEAIALLEKAQRIYVLGCGYHRENFKRLDLHKTRDGTQRAMTTRLFRNSCG